MLLNWISCFLREVFSHVANKERHELMFLGQPLVAGVEMGPKGVGAVIWALHFRVGSYTCAVGDDCSRPHRRPHTKFSLFWCFQLTFLRHVSVASSMIERLTLSSFFIRCHLPRPLLSSCLARLQVVFGSLHFHSCGSAHSPAKRRHPAAIIGFCCLDTHHLPAAHKRCKCNIGPRGCPPESKCRPLSLATGRPHVSNKPTGTNSSRSVVSSSREKTVAEAEEGRNQCRHRPKPREEGRNQCRHRPKPRDADALAHAETHAQANHTEHRLDKASSSNFRFPFVEFIE